MSLERRLLALNLLSLEAVNEIEGVRLALDDQYSPFDYLLSSTELRVEALQFFSRVRLSDGQLILD